MLRHRLLFGTLMIAFLLAALAFDAWLDTVSIDGTALQPIFAGRTYLPAGLVMLAAGLAIMMPAASELRRMVAARGVVIDRFTLMASAAAGLLLAYAIPHRLDAQTTVAIYTTVMAALFAIGLLRFAWRRRADGAMATVSVVMFAFIYLGVMPGFYLAIRRWHSAWLIAAILLVTKSADIGAYFTGRMIGRTRLIPWLSPGKTWEGLVGGLVFCGVVAAAVAMLGDRFGVIGRYDGGREFTAYRFSPLLAAAGGILIGLTGQLGDLVASLFKRDAGIKDSGNAVPGFGGVLDIVDSPILVAPVAFWLLYLAALRG